MSDDEFDVGAGASAPAAGAPLIEAVSEADHMEQLIKQTEEDIKAMRSALHKIRSKRIPDLMAEIGLSEFKHELPDGGWIKVKIADLVSGSLPKDADGDEVIEGENPREAAIEHLIDLGGESLIRSTVALDFAKSQHNEALDLVAQLQEKGYTVSFAETVHPQTLQAFAREKIASGEPIDPEKLGLFTSRIAKLTRSREKS